MYEINGITAYTHIEITTTGAWLCQVQTEYGKNWIVVSGQETEEDQNAVLSILQAENQPVIQMIWVEEIEKYEVKEPANQVVKVSRPSDEICALHNLYTQLHTTVGAMRSAQKGYFDARKKGLPIASSFLTTSKQLEKEVDELLKDELELF